MTVPPGWAYTRTVAGIPIHLDTFVAVSVSMAVPATHTLPSESRPR